MRAKVSKTSGAEQADGTKSLSMELPSDTGGIVRLWWGLSSSNPPLAFPVCLSQPISNNPCCVGYVLLTFKICGPECNILNNKNEGLEETLEDPLEQLKYILSVPCYMFV